MKSLLILKNLHLYLDPSARDVHSQIGRSANTFNHFDMQAKMVLINRLGHDLIMKYDSFSSAAEVWSNLKKDFDISPTDDVTLMRRLMKTEYEQGVPMSKQVGRVDELFLKSAGRNIVLPSSSKDAVYLSLFPPEMEIERRNLELNPLRTTNAIHSLLYQFVEKKKEGKNNESESYFAKPKWNQQKVHNNKKRDKKDNDESKKDQLSKDNKKWCNIHKINTHNTAECKSNSNNSNKKWCNIHKANTHNTAECRSNRKKSIECLVSRIVLS